MVSMVDPTCYVGINRFTDYALHFMIPLLENYPNLNMGDIIRLHRCTAEVRPRSSKIDFRIFRETDILIFPAGDHLNPVTTR